MRKNEVTVSRIAPEELRINLTTRCNLRCIGCSKQGAGPGEPLLLAHYLQLIDEAAATGRLKRLSITGGEPLFPDEREKLFAVLERARSLSLGVRLCSNGHYLSRSLVRELRSLDVDRVQVGLDSSTPGFHNLRSRSRTAWQDAVRGIETAAAGGLAVSVRYTLYTLNVWDVDRTYRLVSDLGAVGFKLRILFPVGGAVGGCLGLVPSADQLARAQYLAIAAGRTLGVGLELSQPCFFSPGGRDRFTVEDNSGCGQSGNASVDPFGVVQYCLFCDDGTAFGNVRDRAFLEAWNGCEIERAREARKRRGKVVGCPAFQVQYERYIGSYLEQFERPLLARTRWLSSLLSVGRYRDADPAGAVAHA